MGEEMRREHGSNLVRLETAARALGVKIVISL